MTGREMEFAFLSDIANDPRDEAAVLIYADWLSEQDDLATVARGEFLRLESILRHGRPGSQRSDFEWQARQLWWDYIEDWIGSVYDAVDHFCYQRGLLTIEVSDHALSQIDLDELVAAPAWDWVRHIGVRRGGLDTLAILSELPRPAFLQSIDIGKKTISETEDEMPTLLSLPILEGLKALDLTDNIIGEIGCHQLAAWQPGASLRKLTLRQAGVTNVALRSLLASPHLANLCELDLCQNFVGTQGARELCKPGVLPRLTRLDLRYNIVDWHDIAALQTRFGDVIEVVPARNGIPVQQT